MSTETETLGRAVMECPWPIWHIICEALERNRMSEVDLMIMKAWLSDAILGEAEA